MIKISKCLNEWNATIEALGHGKQTLLIRKYRTNVKKFLLYPTSSYSFNDNYLDSFKEEYQTFAKENTLPKKSDNKSEVKYYAIVEKVLEKHSLKIGSLNKYHIWTDQHVNSYLGNQKGYVWILRVFKLKKPIMAERTMGITYSNLLKEVYLDAIEPVISDDKFQEIIEEIYI